MFVRLKVVLVLVASLMWSGAMASDLQDLTEAEREAFRNEVRNYLLDNPEVLLEAISVLEQREQMQAAEAERDFLMSNADAIFNDGVSYIGGNPDGDITLVEFMDYRCSFCRRAAPDVHALLKTDGNIRWIVKEFPILGEDSVKASRFAIATKFVAGDEAYGEVHDALMEARGYTDRILSGIARDAGLDPDPILAEMDSAEVSQVIENNRALAQALAITGTPTFILQDELVRGYVPLDGMRTMVRQIRADM